MAVFELGCPDKQMGFDLCRCQPVCTVCGWGKHDHIGSDHPYTFKPATTEQETPHDR